MSSIESASTLSVDFSIVSVCKNMGRFLEETIDSVLMQTNQSWEHIVIDGGSQDETVSVLKKYPHLRWVSEKDESDVDALWKGIRMARGRYLLVCYVSDGYVDRHWLDRCAKVFSEQPEISLIWGVPQYKSEDGSFKNVVYGHFFSEVPPQGRGFLEYWLDNPIHFPEGNLCIRKNIALDCYPTLNEWKKGDIEFWLTFSYRFHRNGYLSYFIPVVASFGREHDDAAGKRQTASGIMKQWVDRYYLDCSSFRSELLRGHIRHFFYDGMKQRLSDGFDLGPYRRKVVKAQIKRIMSNYLPPVMLRKLLWIVSKVKVTVA